MCSHLRNVVTPPKGFTPANAFNASQHAHRCALDNLGYARVRGYTPPPFLTPAVVRRAAARVDKVFVLETPTCNAEELRLRNVQTGRATDPAGSIPD